MFHSAVETKDKIADALFFVIEGQGNADKINKDKVKQYYDKRYSATPSLLKISDKVLVQKPRTNKLSSFYDLKPYTITGINGSMITAKRENSTLTRNSSLFKKVE